jgi:hypothetical protein
VWFLVDGIEHLPPIYFKRLFLYANRKFSFISVIPYEDGHL